MGILKNLSYDLHILEAMANNRKDGINKVNELLNPIIWHLIKIAIYNNPKDRVEQVEHWGDEVLNWLEQIYLFCINLKKHNSLKLRDYKLCLDDDLGREVLVRSKYNALRRKYEAIQVKDFEQLRHILYSILEAQFKAMAELEWDIATLKQNPKYKDLVEYDFKELK